MSKPFASIDKALDDIKNGKMLILVDDESRENEGDLIIAAEKITPEAINFMATFGKGLICLSMSEKLVDRLELPMMVKNNASPYKTAFTVSIEASKGVSTGISASDRATTIKAAIADGASPSDIVSPGHVFPLKAKKTGVLERPGQTEGSVDLARLAGFKEAAVICEIINADGSMARIKDLEQFANKHKINIVSVNDLITYRLRTENFITELASSPLTIEKHGVFTIKVFGNSIDGKQHIAIINEKFGDSPLVRVHSECFTGDIFGSEHCDCGSQLDSSLAMIAKEGGILLYMRQEGRGIGLVNKIKAYALQQEKGLDTVEANEHLGLPVDERDYGISAQILRSLGVTQARLLTNNPQKVKGLGMYGVTVSERIALLSEPTEKNHFYLSTKQSKLGHLLTQI